MGNATHQLGRETDGSLDYRAADAGILTADRYGSELSFPEEAVLFLFRSRREEAFAYVEPSVLGFRLSRQFVCHPRPDE